MSNEQEAPAETQLPTGWPEPIDEREMYWDDRTEKEFFYCDCAAAEPIEDEPWMPVECGLCGGRL